MNETNIDSDQMVIYPVGRVHSEIQTPMTLTHESDLELEQRIQLIRQYHEKVSQSVCEVEIYPPWEALLDGIEGFSHVLVLYWPHLLDPERRHLKRVHPMGRKDLPEQGIFATCSPARPNPVLVSAVRLVERSGNVLRVEGLEAVDGSPVIDIKPYVQTYYGADHPEVPSWMRQIHKELGIE